MPPFLNIVIFVLALIAVVQKTSSFILDAQTCLAYKPCTCSGTTVSCQSKTLIEMPKFYPSNITGSYMYLNRYSNQLTTIPADTFRNLRVSNNTKLHIQFQNNHLNSIATNAFGGIRDANIDYFNLENNNLTYLPSELGTLTNINQLNLNGNPISNLNPSTMYQLGRSLKSLYINLNHYNGWPAVFNSLISLDRLFVQYVNTTHLDYNVFDGFANSLTTLNIQFSQLEKIPVAICHLHKLISLTFANNNNVHVNNTVLEPCSRNLTSVTYVNMQNNQLRYMPNVFQSFPSMTSLNLNSNKLSYIHWDTVPSDAPLRLIQLAYNDFTRIPLTVDKLHSLTSLYMQYNKITSIDESDISNLTLLKVIYLSGNPIEYISPHAFKNNLALNKIYLENTNLRLLPSSLAALQNLKTFYLSGSPIECSCNMSFLKPLNATGISMNGVCNFSSIQIKSYLMNDLPKCP